MSVKPINRGDLISTKDGRKFTVEALRYVGGNLYKIEGVDRNAPSPMRTTIWANDFKEVVKRAPNAYDHDLHRDCELHPDGKTYVPIDRREFNDPHYKTIFKLRADRRVAKLAEVAK